MSSEAEVLKALREVIDPELGVNIVDLGLIYQVSVAEREVEVEMTLTSPGCPLAPVIDQLVREAVKKINGVEEVRLNLVWDPPWVPAMMSEEVKVEFGIEE